MSRPQIGAVPSAPPRDPADPSATPIGHAAVRTKWVELSAALTAVIVSFGSLLIARHQAVVMDRQLAATVWPLVEYDTSNEDDQGKPRLLLTLHNNGVGPTRIRSVRLTYRGRPIRDGGELLRTCCGSAIDTTRAVTTSTSDIAGRVLTAGKSVDFLVLPPDSAQRALYQAFDRERFAVAARVCYCSVLDECWVVVSTGHGGADPIPVASCAAERRAPQYR